jgi:hypothetical protein
MCSAEFGTATQSSEIVVLSLHAVKFCPLYSPAILAGLLATSFSSSPKPRRAGTDPRWVGYVFVRLQPPHFDIAHAIL